MTFRGRAREEALATRLDENHNDQTEANQSDNVLSFLQCHFLSSKEHRPGFCFTQLIHGLESRSELFTTHLWRCWTARGTKWQHQEDHGSEGSVALGSSMSSTSNLWEKPDRKNEKPCENSSLLRYSRKRSPTMVLKVKENLEAP